MFIALLYCSRMLLTDLKLLCLSFMYFPSLYVRSQVPAHKYMMTLWCLLIAFGNHSSMMSTSWDVVAPDWHQLSIGKCLSLQKFLSVKPLLSETKMGVLYLKPSGSCGWRSMYFWIFLLICTFKISIYIYIQCTELNMQKKTIIKRIKCCLDFTKINVSIGIQNKPMHKAMRENRFSIR